MLYDSRYKDFKGKLTTRWLRPNVVERCHDNGSMQIRTIDEEAIPLFVNGHRLKRTRIQVKTSMRRLSPIFGLKTSLR